jgi:hypothetical protein
MIAELYYFNYILIILFVHFIYHILYTIYFIYVLYFNYFFNLGTADAPSQQEWLCMAAHAYLPSHSRKHR